MLRAPLECPLNRPRGSILPLSEVCVLCINLIPVLRACPLPSLVRAGGGGGQQRRALLVARVRVHVREELLRGGALEVAVRQAGVAVRLPPVERVVQGAPDVAGRRFGETELDPVPLEHQLAPRGVHGAAQVGDGESPRLPGPRVREGKAPVADVVRRFGGGRALDGHVERHELVRLVPGIRFELLHCGRGRGRRPGSWRSRRWWRGSRRSRRRRRGSGCRRWRGAKTRRVTLAQRRGVGRAGQLRQRREVRGHGLRLLVSDLLLEGRHRKNSFSSNGTGRLLPPKLYLCLKNVGKIYNGRKSS